MLNFCIFFIYLFTISGADIDLNNICSCDLTKEVCDYNCDCDPDCITFMFNQDYMTMQSRSSSSYSSDINNINSKMDYCKKNITSIDELYNPLILAFKILKKGFCLVFDNSKNSNDKNNKEYNSKIDKIESDDFYSYEINEIANLESENICNFKLMNFSVPITLPSGLCLFGSYQIMKLQDYEVTCSYIQDKSENITNYFNIIESKYEKFIYNDNYYYKSNDIKSEEYVIKKVEIFYFKDDNFNINYFYEKKNDDNNYQDFTLAIKFLKDVNDYPKSGNPGYIKGKQILIGKKIGENQNYYYNYYDYIFPIDISSGNKDNDFYFDNYFNNKITFEDLIIYRYNNTAIEKIITFFKIDNLGFGRYGNANIKYSQDWTEKLEGFEIKKNNEELNYNVNLLFGIYKEVGAVNNTQFEINKIERFYRETDSKVCYFICKFIKPKNVETEWWYARPPGFIRLPKNVMYPFKIGSTDYQTK